MIGLSSSSDSGHAAGFTLIEMLIAVAITLLIAGSLAATVPAARAAFDRVPAELEMQQRGRTAIDLLSQSLRSAERISLDAPNDEGGYSELTVVMPVANGPRGALSVDQAAPASPLTLAANPCSNLKEVCGFIPGAVAMLAAADGTLDVFVIAATNAGTRQLTPERPLSRTHEAGSIIVEVDEHTIGLHEQADGSYSLTRVTAAGAVQPMVDFVGWLAFKIDGHQAQVEVTIQAPTEGLRRVIPDRTFRTSIDVRRAS